MLRSQGKQTQKLLLRCVQAGTQLVRTSFPVKALQIGQTHYAPMACTIQFPQTSLSSYHLCFDQYIYIYIYIYSQREFATSNGKESSNGEEVKQRGTENKKWWQSITRQIGGLFISGAALGSGAWGTKHYISDQKSPSQPPNTFTSNGKPIASPYEETYPPSLIFRYKDLIEIDWKTGNEFHNREDELNHLKQILVDEVNIQDPQMHLMLGFSLCGKTTLITQFLTNHYPDDYPPFIYLHLKEYCIPSMEDFLNCLKEEILRVFGLTYLAHREWGKKQVKMGTRFVGEINVRAILERMESKEYDVKESLIGDVRDLIHEVKQKDKKGRPFLIVIDEINSLKDILDMGEDNENFQLFKSFISMLEDVTKNKKTANVLFCSADGVKFMFEGAGMDWDHYFQPFYIGNKHTLLIF